MTENRNRMQGNHWTCRVYSFFDGRKRPKREYYFKTRAEAKAKEKELKDKHPNIETEIIFYEVRYYG